MSAKIGNGIESFQLLQDNDQNTKEHENIIIPLPALSSLSISPKHILFSVIKTALKTTNQSRLIITAETVSR